MSSKRHSSTAHEALLADARWYAPAGELLPEQLAGVQIVDKDKLPFDRPLVCFAMLPMDNTQRGIAAQRVAVGPEVYLVVVAQGELGHSQISEAISAGADDVLVLCDPGAISLCLARMKRAMDDRKRSHSFRELYLIERDYLQSCIDSLPTPIFFKNARGIYVGCNKAFEAYLGKTADEIIGSSVYDVADPELAKVYEEADQALLWDGTVQVYEANVVFADGQMRDVCFHKAAVTDSKGVSRGIAGAMLDITLHKELQRQLQDAAERDPLTNLFNRRKYMEEAETITRNAKANGAPVVFAVIDIDRFKSVNDRFGHAAGDKALCEVAKALEEGISAPNILARAGGEEFYAIFPGINLADASGLLELVRRKISHINIEAETGTFGITISIGAADMVIGQEDQWACLRRADEALYAAKHGGRNRLELAA